MKKCPMCEQYRLPVRGEADLIVCQNPNCRAIFDSVHQVGTFTKGYKRAVFTDEQYAEKKAKRSRRKKVSKTGDGGRS